MENKFIESLSREISGERTFRFLNLISQHHRIQASPGFRAAAKTCQDILTQKGLEAEIISYPADGNTLFWGSRALLEWNPSGARLEMIKENGIEVLADYSRSELSVIQRFGSTPPEGTEGPVIIGDQKDNLPSLTGKWLLTGVTPEDVRKKVIKDNGLGIIYDGMPALPPVREERGLPNNRQYTSFWGRDEKENPPGFVLTPAQGQKLRKHLEKGEEVVVRGFAKACFYSGNFENVSLLIPGEKKGEILLIGHLCHPRPSAGDNASGAAVLLEVAISLKKLLDSGEIPPLKYGIRFLWVPEMTGTYSYLASQDDSSPEILGALNLDMVGQKQELGGGSLIVENPPLTCPSWGADLLLSILNNPFFNNSHNPYQTASFPSFCWRNLPFSGGSDHYILSDPTVNIPCPMLIQWPDRHYHTDADQPGTIDPEMLQKVGIIAGTYAAFFASSGPGELNWLAERMVSSFAYNISRKTSCGDFSEKDLDWSLARKIEHLLDLKRFDENLKLDKYIEILKRNAASLGPLAKGVFTEISPLENLVPRRKIPGPIDQRFFQWALDKANLSEKFDKICRDYGEKKPAPRSYATHLLYWIDGKRSLTEVLENTYMETGVNSPDFALNYFRLLEEMDLLELKQVEREI